jgi:hypothetical protein
MPLFDIRLNGMCIPTQHQMDNTPKLNHDRTITRGPFRLCIARPVNKDEIVVFRFKKIVLAVLLLAGFLSQIGGTVFAQNRLALVIGNDAYQNVTKLRKAVNDAEGIGQTLSKLGFNVTIATDVSRRQMYKTLQNFNNNIVAGDTVLLFFAGHGVEIEGENYLLPVDVPNASGDQRDFIKSETIRLNRVLSDLRAKKARLNIVILDACRNNPFSNKASRSLGSEKGLARISAPQGTFVMYSADVGEAALDRLNDSDNNPNSIFTRTLIPLMNTPGIDLVDTARQARRQVRKLALSVSHEQTPAYYDAVLGDFFFSASQSGTPEKSVTPIIITPNKSIADIKPDLKIRSEFKTKIKPEIKLALRVEPKLKEQRIIIKRDSVPLPTLIVTAGEKDLIKVWNADNYSLLAELSGEKKLISAIKLINKGRNLLVAGEDGSVVSYHLPTFKKSYAFYPGFKVSVLAQARDGTIMVGGSDGILAAYDGQNFEEIWRRQAHDGIISPILPLNGQVVTASGDGAIVVTDVKSGKETLRIHTFKGGKITDIAFINQTTLAAVHEKGSIAYINIATGRVLSSFNSHQGWISSVDVTPDGTALVTAGVNGDLKYWPIGAKTAINSIPAHSDVAAGAKFLSTLSGKKLASVGFDGKLKLWRQNSRRKIAELNHGPAIVHFDFLSSY